MTTTVPLWDWEVGKSEVAGPGLEPGVVLRMTLGVVVVPVVGDGDVVEAIVPLLVWDAV